jgi:CheY-like chemotaxis protein
MLNNTILVVDDEIGIRELLSEILRDEGYRVALGAYLAKPIAP